MLHRHVSLDVRVGVVALNDVIPAAGRSRAHPAGTRPSPYEAGKLSCNSGRRILVRLMPGWIPAVHAKHGSAMTDPLTAGERRGDDVLSPKQPPALRCAGEDHSRQA